MSAKDIVDNLLGEAAGDPGEDDLLKELTQDMIDADQRWLKVGASISRGTCLAKDIAEAYIEALGEINRSKLNQAMVDHEELFEALRSVQAGSETDTDYEWVDQLAYEVLPVLLEQHCPPFTYLGAHQGDGSDYGCWPNMEALEEEEGNDVTKLEAETIEAAQFKAGNYKVTTPFVWVHADYGDDELWDAPRHRLIWKC